MSTLTTLGMTAVPQLYGSPHIGDGPPFPFVLIPIFWLLVLVGIATAVVLHRRRRDRAVGALAGEQVLAERFAAGALDEDEYRSRRAVLREKR